MHIKMNLLHMHSCMYMHVQMQQHLYCIQDELIMPALA